MLFRSIAIARGRRNAEVANTYRNFCRDEISARQGAGVNLKATELIRRWGDRTKQPECKVAADREDACVEKRKTMRPYEHNECSLSPVMDSRSSSESGSTITGRPPR